MSSVTVFSTASCPWCVKAKEHLDQLGVAYDAVNVGEDREAAREMIEKTRQRGVPVIRVGERYIVGFNPDEIDSALKAADIIM